MAFASGSSPRRPFRGIWQVVPSLLLAGLSVTLYLGTLHNPFVYDDRITVVENPSLRHPGEIRAVLLFSRYRPLVNLSFAADRAVWGLNPVGYHLSNVVLHAFNVALAFGLLLGAVRDAQRSGSGTGGPDVGSAPLIAFVGAALFAVHPMMTEAVGYVSGRGDVLSGTFFLLAFLAMRVGLVSGRARWTVLGLVLWIFALASKEVAAMFPFVLLAYDRFVLRPARAEARRRLLRRHLPLIVAVVLAGVTRIVVFLAVEQRFSAQLLKQMAGYLVIQFQAVWKYVQLLLFPVRQSIAHNPPGPMALSLAGAVALALVCLLAYRVRARAPLVSFGIAWFLLLLVPSSSILPLQSAIAEHRVYLASLGLFLVVAVGFGRLAQAVRVRSFGMRAVLYAAGVLILADLTVLTLTRNAVWADPVALWREAATTAPRWDTYMAYGNALRDAGDCESALAAYNSAIRIAPERLLPVVSGWICLVMLGKTDQAREVARYINRVDPQLDRLCQEVHALAPHMVSLQSCVQQFRPLLGSGDG